MTWKQASDAKPHPTPDLLYRRLHFIKMGGRGRVGGMVLEYKASL